LGALPRFPSLASPVRFPRFPRASPSLLSCVAAAFEPALGAFLGAGVGDVARRRLPLRVLLACDRVSGAIEVGVGVGVGVGEAVVVVVVADGTG
jgi:hypothetical protein